MHQKKKDFPNIMTSATTYDLMDSQIKATRMSQMKLLLKMQSNRGHHFRNTKLTKFFHLVKVYLNIHDMTNNPNKENGICIKSLLISKEVNIIVLHSIIKMVEKLLEESF